MFEGSLKFCHILVENPLSFLPRFLSLPCSFHFHFDIVWSERLFSLPFFSPSISPPSPLLLILWVGRCSVCGGGRGVRQETTGPLQQHPPFGFALLFLLLLLFTPPDPSHSVEIITVRLNSQGFRFSLPLSALWQCCLFSPFCPRSSGKPQSAALFDKLALRCAHMHVCVCLALSEPHDDTGVSLKSAMFCMCGSVCV